VRNDTRLGMKMMLEIATFQIEPQAAAQFANGRFA
jgi:hypothetical protein